MLILGNLSLCLSSVYRGHNLSCSFVPVPTKYGASKITCGGFSRNPASAVRKHFEMDFDTDTWGRGTPKGFHKECRENSGHM